ncbi:unnamed protein product [Heligmosomoides polygyrus]|uniref:Secreted protein n=1 Tax=Heligmosomoides polygyrus TaxID=6339 RepID=A0A183FK72_HELPZ|nr:unnamed protein product [Heligmosomoides polygyrus]
MMLFLAHITLIFLIGVLVGLYLSRRRSAPPQTDDARSSRSWFSLASRLSSTSFSFLRGNKKTVAYTAVEEERPYRTVEKWTQSVDTEGTFVKKKRTPSSQLVKEAATQEESPHAELPIQGEHRTQVATPTKTHMSKMRAVFRTKQEEHKVETPRPAATAHTQTASRPKLCPVSPLNTSPDCQGHVNSHYVHGQTPRRG